MLKKNPFQMPFIEYITLFSSFNQIKAIDNPEWKISCSCMKRYHSYPSRKHAKTEPKQKKTKK
jgi:hypothetical protein